jgi:hypothetical protein
MPRAEWIRIDRAGNLTGVLVLPASSTIVEALGNEIAVIEKGSFDEPYLRCTASCGEARGRRVGGGRARPDGASVLGCERDPGRRRRDLSLPALLQPFRLRRHQSGWRRERNGGPASFRGNRRFVTV